MSLSDSINNFLPHPDLIKFINIAKNQKAKTAFDLGCGTGANLVELARNNFEVEGVDFSPFACENAERKLREEGLNGKVYVSNIFEKITFIEKSSYDCVIAVNSIHLTDQKTFQKTLKEVNRILKTNGLFFLTVPSKESVIEIEKEQLVFEEDSFRELIEKTFDIVHFDIDKNKYFVVIAKEREVQ